MWQDQEGFNKGEHNSSHVTSSDVLCSLTEQVVPRQSVQDAGRSDQVTHGSGQRGGVNADRHEGMPDVNVSEKSVIFLQEDPRERRRTWQSKLVSCRCCV